MDYNNIMGKYFTKTGEDLSVMKFVRTFLIIFSMVMVNGCLTTFWDKDPTLGNHNVEILNESDPDFPRIEESDQLNKETEIKQKTWSNNSENTQIIKESASKPDDLSSGSEIEKVTRSEEAKWIPESKPPTKKKKRSKSKRRTKKKSINHELPVYGYVEKIRLGAQELKVKAKLDSGAAISSLHAENMVEFERDGKKWIRFHVKNPQTKELVQFERKLKRYAKVKQHERESQVRPVILMEVRLGETYIQREFNLTNRENFLYQVLLGRNFLNGVALIDVSQTFLATSSRSSASLSK